MKLHYYLTVALTLSMAWSTQAQMEKRASPMDSVEETVNGAEIEIIYSRPSVKDREIYGGLVPYDKVWRTGANEATVFSTSKDLVINGKTLKAGDYALFTIPGKDKWTVILNGQHKQWGAYSYDKSRDAMRFEVKPAETDQTEMLTFKIDKSGKIMMDWATTRIAFNIKVKG